MLRRLAMTVATTIGLSFAPATPNLDVRISAPRAPHVTVADRQAALRWIAATMATLQWQRFAATVSFPPDPSRPCPYERLIRYTFPDWPDAVDVAWRESRCQPAAANRTSSARGLMQLLMSLHSRRFVAAGCAPSDWSDAWCNLAAARDLFDDAGTSPWRVR